MLGVLGSLVATRFGALVLHEGAHVITARICGHSSTTSISLTGLSKTSVPGIEKSPLRAMLVRHAGWMMSVALAVAAMCYGLAAAPTMVLWLTAFDGLLTDLLGFVAADDTFFCGNFGLLLLDKAAASHVRKMIEKSVRVTMMRGAQSAGIVTYVPKGKGAMGIRKRVVNGKRTDLCDLLMAKCGSKLSTSACRARSSSRATLDSRRHRLLLCQAAILTNGHPGPTTTTGRKMLQVGAGPVSVSTTRHSLRTTATSTSTSGTAWFIRLKTSSPSSKRSCTANRQPRWTLRELLVSSTCCAPRACGTSRSGMPTSPAD
jgi:hypothetical protein